MIEYKNLWSNWENIRENPEKYKEWKIDQILNETMNENFCSLSFENGEIDFSQYYDFMEFLKTGLLPILQKMDFSNIMNYCFGNYEYDDFYCILFFDNEMKIVNKIFWDFDYDFMYDFYDCVKNFNVFEWL